MNRETVRHAAFPTELTAEMVAGFKKIGAGSTWPRKGEIGGVKFVLKGSRWGSYDANADRHVHNEVVADGFLRAAGLNVPDSREYHADLGHGGVETVRLSRLIDAVNFGERFDSLSVGSNQRRRLAHAVANAYPVLSFMAAVDTFKHNPMDNLMIGEEESVWFVDNGAMFGFRARGTLIEPEHYETRLDPAGPNGFFWLRDHDDGRHYYCQRDGLAEIFRSEKVDDAMLIACAAKYDFVALAKTLPSDYQTDNLMAYAQALNEWVARRNP